MPFGFMRFESKVRRHQDFKGWVEHILGQADMGKFLEEVGVLRPIQYALLMDVDRSLADVAFLTFRWSSYSHTFVVAWGEFCPSLEEVVKLTNLPVFGTYHAVDVLDNEGEKLVEGLHDAMTRAKYISNKRTYLSWLKYFTEGAGQNSACQLATFFAY